jgi:hypothetical protein
MCGGAVNDLEAAFSAYPARLRVVRIRLKVTRKAIDVP